MLDYLQTAGIESVVSMFRGECSVDAITSHTEALSDQRVDCVIAVGGGKCIDAAKSIAFRLGTPVVIVPVGARPTLASAALSEVCAQTLFKEGCAAAAAVVAKTANDSLETVVEANTLLSGLGFESGGVAAAHGMAQSYTGIPQVHVNYLHGEMVAMGTLAQLMMESRPDEAVRVAEFFAKVGLPIHLGQLSLDASDEPALKVVIEGTVAFPFIGNMPMPVTAELVRSALLDAHRMGLRVAEQTGDAAYRRLHQG